LSRAVSSWSKTFTDLRLCAAMVGQLTFNGHIIETACSYRLAQAGANVTAHELAEMQQVAQG
jgi:hypothetical protein